MILPIPVHVLAHVDVASVIQPDAEIAHEEGEHGGEGKARREDGGDHAWELREN